ncbi:MAG: histidinol-phosphatase HisJ family protein [Clostridia bacterium]|nr:histidinol-phosphatase HisJ family protein [Clostridia bacterium]
MEKILTDLHTHTAFSPDGKDDISAMLAGAESRGVRYYGISEHIDYDMQLFGETAYDTPYFTDADEYFRVAREKKREYHGRIEVLVGAEFGYTDDEEAERAYRAFIQKYRPDFVINSVHTLKGKDYHSGVPYRLADGSLRPKKEVYEEYFALVKRGIEASFQFDIVGHVGYCTRYAPYADKSATYAEFSEAWDSVLRAVVERGKILEVNSSNKLGVSPTLPDRDVLERYFELSGRKVSFGSDAHFAERILDKREYVVKMLKEIGFTALTVPVCGEHKEIEL